MAAHRTIAHPPGLLLAASLAATVLGCGARTEQPIAFNHQKHVADVGVECIDCHKYNRTQTYSGMPTLEECSTCHDEKASGSPELVKLAGLIKAKREPAWGRLHGLPDYVYYSHRRHVTLAKIPCERCHGPIAKTTTPPGRALVQHTMDFCIDCHRQRGVTNDCDACHR